MSSCKEISAQIPFYLDDELHGDDKKAFEAHMDNCPNCRKALAREQVFLDGIRDVGQLYQVPAGLKARIEPILKQESTAVTSLPTSLSYRQRALPFRFLPKINRAGWIGLAATVIIVFVLSAIYAT